MMVWRGTILIIELVDSISRDERDVYFMADFQLNECITLLYSAILCTHHVITKIAKFFGHSSFF